MGLSPSLQICLTAQQFVEMYDKWKSEAIDKYLYTSFVVLTKCFENGLVVDAYGQDDLTFHTLVTFWVFLIR